MVNSATSFLSGASERFFNERPYLKHQCYIFLTKKPQGRRTSSSAYSGLFRKSIVPQQVLKQGFIDDFADKANQFERILQDSSFVKLKRLSEDELAGNQQKTGLLERYCFLLDEAERPIIRDIQLRDELKIDGTIFSSFLV